MAEDECDIFQLDRKLSETSSIFPAYTLYRYHVNRPKECASSSSSSTTSADQVVEPSPSASESSVASFLQKEATCDGNFSLSVVATSLSAENETELRKFIAKRLSRGTVYSGSGNISTLELHVGDGNPESAWCYYCLLRKDAASPYLIPDQPDSYCSNEFVVCFMSSADVGLDLFKQELDSYSADLLPLLDADLSDLESKVKPYLEKWTDEVMNYLCRCLRLLGDDVSRLIYAALVDLKVVIQGGDKQGRADIKKFVDCCSLSELLNHMTTEVAAPVSSDGVSSLLLNMDHYEQTQTKSQQPLTVTLEGGNVHFDKLDCTRFCEDWAATLNRGDSDNPVFLRQVIDDFKLKAIQDMNTLKRLIRQAETDHYALYRSYVFLNNSGNGSILLQHARLELRSLTLEDTKNVLKALDDFIQEMGGFPNS